MKKLLNLSIFVLLLFCLTFAVSAKAQREMAESGTAAANGNAKYVFLFIGDGMGMPQINSAEAYLSSVAGEKVGVKKLSFSQFPAQGLTTTYAADQFITDSAASATALACGLKTNSGVIAMDPTGTKKFKTIAEMAKEAGLKVGIVSSVDLDHATPASFYAHNKSRNNYYDIGLELANSSFDYFGGGRLRLSKAPKDKKNQHEVLKEKGWIMAGSREELNKIKPNSGQVYAYNYGFASDALVYDLDRKEKDITLAEFTKKGIELLANDNGFFMMIEGGKIDWACHANDAASAIHDTLAFDAAVQEAIKFYDKHPNDTLIIVTGDHECGGLTLGFAGTKYGSAYDLLKGQTGSQEAFNEYVLKPYKKKVAGSKGNLNDLIPAMEKHFGLSAAELSDYEKEMIANAFDQTMLDKKERAKDDATFLLYGGYEPLSVTLTHILNQKAGLAWTSYSHTGVPVPTFAKGNGAPLFHGYYDNTDIFHKMIASMKQLLGSAR